MLAIFLETLPFFCLIAVGFGAGRTGFFTPEATAYLTKFVFYFALSAMIFSFSADLSLAELWSWPFAAAYLSATTAVYLLATLIGMARGRPVAEVAVEAQCAVIGNVGFLGLPMLVLLLGSDAVGPIMLVLAIDLIVFSSLIVILITGSRDHGVSPRVLRTVGLGLLSNPMIVSIVAGLAWSALELPFPAPMESFLSILGAAATPGALFAIGASLADKSAERVSVALYLSSFKLIVHPAAVALAALVIFDVAPYQAMVMVAAAALPVAGNVYILAQHYGVAPARVSTAILFSTTASVATVPLVIGWLQSLSPS
ncbi:MAG: AEC family transporter [Pseudomonadota bacterium]